MSISNALHHKVGLTVLRAEHMGMCFGVRDAIALAERVTQSRPLTVLGELVHNPVVLDDLRGRGVRFENQPGEVETETVMITAHGASEQVRDRALENGLELRDATCPLVSKIHKEVENFDKKNLPVILIGHRNHPEVIGTMGQTDKKIHLVEKVEDVKKLPLNQNDEIAYVTQTTLSVDDTKDIIKEIKLHFSNVIEPKKNDICYATTNRQEAVKKIANQCDYFLVIGASNSSNSLRLVEVAKNYGSKKAILVEDVDSLNLNIFQESENIGITASASSPEILVRKLLDNLKKNFELQVNEGHYQKEDVFFKVPQKLNV